ncbi:MAG: protein-disulfide reductase DsbD domain-containing protein [Verrucomicrobiota bacterium]
MTPGRSYCPPLLVGLLLLSSLCSAGETPPSSAEGEEIHRPGLTLQWISDHDQIERGETLTLGLLIRHKEGFHTYWKSPGVVGLAPGLKWELPEGITAGPILWPGPELTKMGRITAWGYEREVLLTTTIEIDPNFPESVLPLKAEVSWMACSDTCHPGWASLSLEIPIGPSHRNKSHAELFRSATSELPVPLPEDWKFHLEEVAGPDSEWTVAHLKSPRPLEAAGVVFFCSDNQVHSDLPQKITTRPFGLELRFPRSEFAPSDATVLEGVLFHPKGWPTLESHWIQVSAFHP